jgi:hypothetical protein
LEGIYLQTGILKLKEFSLLRLTDRFNIIPINTSMCGLILRQGGEAELMAPGF